MVGLRRVNRHYRPKRAHHRLANKRPGNLVSGWNRNIKRRRLLARTMRGTIRSNNRVVRHGPTENRLITCIVMFRGKTDGRLKRGKGVR